MKKMNSKKYDRGYVDATDKLRVFIESQNKVMYINHGYDKAETARNAYNKAIDMVRCRGFVRVIVSKGELFLIRKDI